MLAFCVTYRHQNYADTDVILHFVSQSDADPDVISHFGTHRGVKPRDGGTSGGATPK